MRLGIGIEVETDSTGPGVGIGLGVRVGTGVGEDTGCDEGDVGSTAVDGVVAVSVEHADRTAILTKSTDTTAHLCASCSVSMYDRRDIGRWSTCTGSLP